MTEVIKDDLDLDAGETQEMEVPTTQNPDAKKDEEPSGNEYMDHTTVAQKVTEVISGEMEALTRPASQE